jgi:hypothetical protein
VAAAKAAAEMTATELAATARATCADVCAPPQARHQAVGEFLHVYACRRGDEARLARRHPLAPR